MFPRAAFLALFLVFLGGAGASAEDPPGRVGRLAHVEGTVSQRAAAQDDWSAAAVNAPLTTGHGIWTESGARAEVQVGPAEVRLNELTELDVLRLDDRAQRFALRQGSVNVRLGAAALGGFTLDTPRGPVGLAGPGRYRIDVDGETGDEVQLTVFEGEAQLEREHAGPVVKQGESLRLAGDPLRLSRAEVRTTALDRWALDRERGATASAALTHVSPHMTGHQDLDAHGTWEPAPAYGTVWVPRVVDDGWAPYRHGRWAYVAPWGWTWIDDAPWGFAPFHYGRWVRVGHRWAWWPGAYAPRPVYAPALVAFVGGDGWSVSAALGGVGAIGWVPLAPHEVYRPHYRTSVTYIRNVNITTVNRTVINKIKIVNRAAEAGRFANRGAATVMRAESFARGHRVREAKLDVPHRHIEQARTTTEPRRIAPVAAASRDGRHEARWQHRPRHDEARRSEARGAPAFEQRAMAKPEPAPQPQPAVMPPAPAPQSAKQPGRPDRRDAARDERTGDARDARPGHDRRTPSSRAAQHAPVGAASTPPPHVERRQARDAAHERRRREPQVERETSVPAPRPAPHVQERRPEPYVPPQAERRRPPQVPQAAPRPDRARPHPQVQRARTEPPGRANAPGDAANRLRGRQGGREG